jgi:hypothetical protein
MMVSWSMGVVRHLVLLAVVTPGVLAAQRVDTVRVGTEVLKGATLTPGAFVIENFQREEGLDKRVSTTRQAVRRGDLSGQPVWIIETVHASTDTTRSSIVARADDFSLVHHRVKAPADSAVVSAGHGFLTGWVVLPDEPVRLLGSRLGRRVFPVEGQVPWLFPLLPLEEGYAAAIPHFNQWRGEESWQVIRVIGAVTIEIAGESFDCWTVDGGELFPGYRVTYWVDRRTRRIVRGVARGEGDGPVYWSQLAVDGP